MSFEQERSTYKEKILGNKTIKNSSVAAEPAREGYFSRIAEYQVFGYIAK